MSTTRRAARLKSSTDQKPPASLEAQIASLDTNAEILLLQICLSHRGHHRTGTKPRYWQIVWEQFEKELGRPFESPRDYLHDLIDDRRMELREKKPIPISFEDALLDQWIMRVNKMTGLCPEIEEMASRYARRYTTHVGRGFVKQTGADTTDDGSYNVVKPSALGENPRKRTAIEAWLDDTTSEPECKGYNLSIAGTHTNDDRTSSESSERQRANKNQSDSSRNSWVPEGPYVIWKTTTRVFKVGISDSESSSEDESETTDSSRETKDDDSNEFFESTDGTDSSISFSSCPLSNPSRATNEPRRQKARHIKASRIMTKVSSEMGDFLKFWHDRTQDQKCSPKLVDTIFTLTDGFEPLLDVWKTVSTLPDKDRAMTALLRLLRDKLWRLERFTAACKKIAMRIEYKLATRIVQAYRILQQAHADGSP